MRILEVITLSGDRLRDALWLSRLEAKGLRESFCLLGSENTEICIDDGNSCIHLDSGQVVLLPPGKSPRLKERPPHRAEKNSAANGFVGAAFFRPDNSSELRNILHLLLRHNAPLNRERMKDFFGKLYELFAGHGVFSLQACSHALCSFLYELAESAARHTTAPGGNIHIERALELMNTRVRDNLSLKELAEEAHLSEAHFIRLFSRRMQMPPMKYFMRLKIHSAANMIIQGAKIKEVAEFTGFYNDAHFSKQFKKYMGVPPSEYKPRYVENLKIRHSENKKSLHFITHVLADFIDAIPDMVFFKDTFYVYRLCNSAFCQYVGRGKEDIYGHTDFTIFRPDIAAEYRRYDERVMGSLQAYANEEWVVYPDGRTHYVEAFKAPFFGPDRELLGLVAVCRDITDRSDKTGPVPPIPHGRAKTK